MSVTFGIADPSLFKIDADVNFNPTLYLATLFSHFHIFNIQHL